MVGDRAGRVICTCAQMGTTEVKAEGVNTGAREEVLQTETTTKQPQLFQLFTNKELQVVFVPVQITDSL